MKLKEARGLKNKPYLIKPIDVDADFFYRQEQKAGPTCSYK
ncbi:hypothetical protein ACFOWA_10665 [Pedobacter lithocola]|uniref:Uncharacterized protein n=1 Tax=Pedobacter lithocola TaxID=1908239 RepID=A0ABV8PBY4_9SPHI